MSVPFLENITITLLGAKGVGKTTMIRRLTTGEFDKKTEDVPPSTMIVHTTCGTCTLHFSEQNRVEDCRPTDVLMVLFDRNDPESWEFAKKCFDEAYLRYDNVFLLSTKTDVKAWNEYIHVNEIEKHVRDTDVLEWIQVSYKSNYNFEKPLLSAVREAQGAYASERWKDMRFIEAPSSEGDEEPPLDEEPPPHEEEYIPV